MRFVFGSHELDVDQLELRRAGERVALEPQAFDVLLHLVRHRDRVVPKEELMDTVWGGRFVSETAVTSRIKQVRRALGDDGATQSRVRTYHGRGYRFVADVAEDPASTLRGPAAGPTRPAGESTGPAAGSAAPGSPLLELAGAAGPTAWQLVGQGPPDLLLLPAVLGTGRAQDDALVAGLGRMARVIRFDTRPLPEPDLAAVCCSVLDAAASERAVVWAPGPRWTTALTLAATVPERVVGIVVFGAVDVPGDVAVRAQGLAVPTLVLHRSGDPVAPISGGRLLASALPGGEFRALSGSAHEAGDDAGQVCGAVADLVETAAAEVAADQTLTALVGLAGGDVTSLVSVLVELGGRERRGPEGSVVVSFAGPAAALRALGSRRARGLAEEVGIGVAIDEVSRSSRLVSGHGVDVARLFARHAAPGEVLVPNVIKDLLAGSGLVVETREPLDLPYVGPHPVHRWVRR